MSMPTFEWDNNCFICGMYCHPSHRYPTCKGNWSLVETTTDNMGENIYTKVLQVAEAQCDRKMLQRVHGIRGDLVAKRATGITDTKIAF